MAYTTASQRKEALGKFDSKLAWFFNESLFTPLPKPKNGEWLKSARTEAGQTFETFKTLSNKPNFSHNKIYIQPLDYIPEPMINYLYQYCVAFFPGINIEIFSCSKDYIVSYQSFFW